MQVTKLAGPLFLVAMVMALLASPVSAQVPDPALDGIVFEQVCESAAVICVITTSLMTTKPNLYCARQSGTDVCTGGGNSIDPNHYIISWCSSSCRGYSTTNGIIDLALEDDIRWCVSVTSGAMSGTCGASWPNNVDDISGGNVDGAGSMNGWFSVDARES